MIESRWWRARSLRPAAIVAASALLVLAVVALRLTLPGAAPAGGETAAAAQPVEPFEFQLRVTDAADGASVSNTRLAWRVLGISSSLSFGYEPIDRPDQECVAENLASDLDGILRFKDVRKVLAAFPRAVACTPCPACSAVSLEWFLDQERFATELTDRCWNTAPEVQALRNAVEGVVAAAYGRVLCS